MSEPSDSKRLPRNAAPIPCPISGYNDSQSLSPPLDGFVGSLTTGSPSLYSEFDVVLDDGTLQKRTVSLSTIPYVNSEDDEDLALEEDEDEFYLDEEAEKNNDKNKVTSEPASQLRKERLGDIS
jgi:hypothetical protein